MAKIPLDLTWAKSVMNNSPARNEEKESKYKWESMTGAGTFKFRILPPNMKSPGKFGMVVGKHYGLGKEGKDSCICVESTFPEYEGIICPVCEAIRRMKRDGIEDAKKYEPGIYSYIKTLMLETPNGKCEDLDKITIFKTKGNYNLNWIINEYMDPDSSDFLNPETGNIIRFSRDKKDGKWERKVLPSSERLSDNDEIQKKLLDENEEICLEDLFKKPDDQGMLKIKELAEELESSLRLAFNTHMDTVDEMKSAAAVKEPEYKSPEEVNNLSTVGTVVPESEEKESSVNNEIEEKIKSMKPHSAEDCFGDDKVYSDKSTACLKCPYSFECSSCIRDIRGINVVRV